MYSEKQVSIFFHRSQVKFDQLFNCGVLWNFKLLQTGKGTKADVKIAYLLQATDLIRLIPFQGGQEKFGTTSFVKFQTIYKLEEKQTVQVVTRQDFSFKLYRFRQYRNNSCDCLWWKSFSKNTLFQKNKNRHKYVLLYIYENCSTSSNHVDIILLCLVLFSHAFTTVYEVFTLSPLTDVSWLIL